MFDRLRSGLEGFKNAASDRLRQIEESLPWFLYQLGNDPEFVEKLEEIEGEVLGAKNYFGVPRGGLIQSGPIISYLEEIVERLRVKEGWTGEGKLRVVVFLGRYSRNALMTAWGTIYVGEKLLRLFDSEAEIAAILGHEITHFQRIHSRLHPALTLEIVARRIELFKRSSGSTILQTLEKMVDGPLEDRSQGMEFEADRGAVELLARAGYPIEAVEVALQKVGNLSPEEQRFRKKMKEFEYKTPKSVLRRKLLETGAVYATHPDSELRLSAIRKRADEVRYQALLDQEYLGWRDWGHGIYSSTVSQGLKQ